jgi:hypothetical protein
MPFWASTIQIRKQGGVFYYYVAIMALTGLMIFLLVIGTS